MLKKLSYLICLIVLLSSCAAFDKTVKFDFPTPPEYRAYTWVQKGEWFCVSEQSARNISTNRIEDKVYIKKLKITLDACNKIVGGK